MSDMPTTLLRYAERARHLRELIARGLFFPDARIVAMLLLAWNERRAQQ